MIFGKHATIGRIRYRRNLLTCSYIASTFIHLIRFLFLSICLTSTEMPEAYWTYAPDNFMLGLHVNTCRGIWLEACLGIEPAIIALAELQRKFSSSFIVLSTPAYCALSRCRLDTFFLKTLLWIFSSLLVFIFILGESPIATVLILI